MLLLQLPVELLCLLTMRQTPFAQFASVRIYASNLLKARMIITPYNQHVRLLSSEPFGWFAPPKSTRAWEPTLFMESFHPKPPHPYLLPQQHPTSRRAISLN